MARHPLAAMRLVGPHGHACRAAQRGAAASSDNPPILGCPPLFRIIASRLQGLPHSGLWSIVIVTQATSSAVVAELRAALAAILDQEREQPTDAIEVDGVDDAPLITARSQQAGALELREVCGQGRGCKAQPLGDLPGGQSPRPFADEKPEHAQSMLLGQPGQYLNRDLFIHISYINEMTKDTRTDLRQVVGARCRSGSRAPGKRKVEVVRRPAGRWSRRSRLTRSIPASSCSISRPGWQSLRAMRSTGLTGAADRDAQPDVRTGDASG